MGAGYPISGLLAGISLSAAFWFGAVAAVLAMVLAVVFVSPTSGQSSAKLDVAGAVLLTIGLAALLIAIAEGSGWGWGAPETIVLFVVAIVFFLLWGAQELRVSEPLVDLRLARHPAVFTADVAALVLGIAMYMYLTGVSEFVQAPKELGYGFSASVVLAGLCLVPFSVVSILGSRTLPFWTRLLGKANLLPVGALIVAAGGVVFALFNGGIWSAFVIMGVMGLGYGLTYGAIPGMIVGAVPESETGSATGFYQVVRYIGFSLGSAISATLLASETPAGSHLPRLAGYDAITWTGVGICVLAAIIAWVLPGRGPKGGAEPTASELRREQEEAELASAGLPGVRPE